MEVRRNDTVLACAICGRTLLLGEHAELYRAERHQLRVCQLCTVEAEQRGWLRAGVPDPPPVVEPERRGEGRLARLIGSVRGEREPEPEPPREPVSAGDADALATTAREGIEAFNQSPYRRTVWGIAKSLGEPQVSVVALSGARPDVVVTVAWDISWYQYRVDVAAAGAVRLENRGDDPADLDDRWRAWNAHVSRDGRLAMAGRN